MDTVMLEAGLVIESVKRKVPQYIAITAEWLDSKADELDAKYGKPYPCSGNFLCLRETVRHKVGCPGRTEPIEHYVRKLKQC